MNFQTKSNAQQLGIACYIATYATHAARHEAPDQGRVAAKLEWIKFLCTVTQQKNFEQICCIRSSSSRSRPSLTSRYVWRVLSLQLKHLWRFWPPLFGRVLRGSKGELLAPEQKRCSASVCKTMRSIRSHKTLRLDVLAHHWLRKATGSRLKKQWCQSKKIGRLVDWAPELFDPWRKQVLTQLTCSPAAAHAVEPMLNRS